MKKLLLAAIGVTVATGAFAQGTVNLANRITGTLMTYVYAPNAANNTLHQVGNSATDTPTGTADWTGYAKIGANGTGGQYGAATTFAQLLAGPIGTAESSLTAAAGVTTFRTGGAAGNLVAISSTLNGVAAGDPGCVYELAVWDNSSGLYSTWAQAKTAWNNGLIAAGTSGAITLNKSIGGGTITPPNLEGLPSFNIYYSVPEPSTMALAGLGAAALLIFRRRK